MARGRVASWEELRNDKIAVSGIINQFFLQKSNLIGQNGLSTPELLWRYIMINTEVEGLISNYINQDSEYWVKVNKLKKTFVPELVKMPQNSAMILGKISLWNQLLSSEFAKLDMMITKRKAARV